MILRIEGTNRALVIVLSHVFFFFQAEDGIRDIGVTGVQTCALPISVRTPRRATPPPGPHRWRPGLHPRGPESPPRPTFPPGPSPVRGHPDRVAQGGQIGRASCRERG